MRLLILGLLILRLLVLRLLVLRLRLILRVLLLVLQIRRRRGMRVLAPAPWTGQCRDEWDAEQEAKAPLSNRASHVDVQLAEQRFIRGVVQQTPSAHPKVGHADQTGPEWRKPRHGKDAVKQPGQQKRSERSQGGERVLDEAHAARGFEGAQACACEQENGRPEDGSQEQRSNMAHAIRMPHHRHLGRAGRRHTPKADSARHFPQERRAAVSLVELVGLGFVVPADLGGWCGR